MKLNCFVVFIITLFFADCTSKHTKTTQDAAEIAGCWEGGPVLQFDRPPSEWRLFTLRPDSSLVLSMIYEIGPQSRVWTTDAEVTVSGGRIQWDYHEGSLSENSDTMTVVKEFRNEKSLWRFVRKGSADSLMRELYACKKQPYLYRVPENRDDGWLCADMAASRIDESKIIKLIEEIRNGRHDDIHSFLLVKDDRLIVEEYFAQNGQKQSHFITSLFRDRVHHLASTTKSVTSALVGIAIDHGFIKGVEEPIWHYLPAYASLFSEEKRRIRICDMLTMTPGFEWRQFGVNDANNDGMHMWATDDVIRYVLQRPLDAGPGEKFNYTNGVPTVTGAIIKNAVGMEVSEFAERYLFGPLGISEYLWTSYPDGSLETDGGLALRPRDLAKIGELFLNGGIWNGQRIVSEGWIRESTQERLKFGRLLRWGYGYHWMRAETRIGNRVVRSFFVPGDGNQIVAVFPDFEMVVVFTAGNYGVDPKPVYYSLFEEFILPAVISDE